MSKMRHFSIEEAETLFFDAIRSAGAADAPARSLARATIEAERSGQPNVGTVHLFDYLDGLREGRIDGRAEPRVTRPAPAVFASDAGGGIAQLGFDLAFDDLVAAARQYGVAMFSQKNAFTCGALGTFAVRLARKDLVSFAATNGPALLAGSGSKEAVYCTNPMAFAAPQAGGPPLLIDQSSSATAFANIRIAAAKGQSIPEDWAIDADGNPTTDPRAAMKGAMVAFGGARGANIALMVEVLSAGLTGANWSLDAPSFIRGSESPATGLFVLAIDPQLIDPDFKVRLAAQLARLSDEHGVHIPGVSKGETWERAAQNGLEIDDTVVERLKADA